MNNDEFNDIRTSAELRVKTFSNYSRSNVKTALLSSLQKSDIESSCNWSAELISSGHFLDVWEIIILFSSRNIHLGNPKLPIYLAKRMEDFKKILNLGYRNNELGLRNNPKIRKLFAEIVTILCTSKKKHAFENFGKPKSYIFEINGLKNKLQAPTVDFCKDIFSDNDPKDIYIALNEFSYHISKKSLNLIMACFWIDWIIEYEIICRTNRNICKCERRYITKISNQFQTDVVWLLWDALFAEILKRKNKLYEKILHALHDLFCIRYTFATKKKRKYILYFASSLLTETVDLSCPLINNHEMIKLVGSKINLIYREIKKNEKSPNTDYLYNGLERTNLEKTVEKLEKLKELDKFMPELEE